MVEIPPAGKSGALRAAEALTFTLPRIYLDADVEVAGSTVVHVAEALNAGAMAARPPVRFCTEGASWFVRRYYAARRRIPSVVSDLCGAGIYGLFARARQVRRLPRCDRGRPLRRADCSLRRGRDRLL